MGFRSEVFMITDQNAYQIFTDQNSFQIFTFQNPFQMITDWTYFQISWSSLQLPKLHLFDQFLNGQHVWMLRMTAMRIIRWKNDNGKKLKIVSYWEMGNVLISITSVILTNHYCYKKLSWVTNMKMKWNHH